MLKDFQPRLYQETIFASASQHNALVVLPTGLGKTAIAMMLASHRLQSYPKQKILILAPTRPLVEQHYNTFQKHLPMEDYAFFTGNVPPEKRAKQWEQSTLIFSTPQGVQNDILAKRITLHEVSLIVFDEAHKAVKDYAYVFIAKNYAEYATHPRILALTASPGTDNAMIQNICENLSIEKIEVRTPQDRDVSPYVQEVDVDWVNVEPPEAFKKATDLLTRAYQHKFELAKSFGHVGGTLQNYTKKTLLTLQGQLQGQVARGQKDYEILKTISVLAEMLKLDHAKELLETQSLQATKQYFLDMQTQAKQGKSKAVQNLVTDANFVQLTRVVDDMIAKGLENPKLKELKNLVSVALDTDPSAKILIFTQYRDQGDLIQKNLTTLGVRSEVFVGQAKKRGKGMSQKEQQIMIERFKENEFPVLVATSVAEEGLDIPSVDLVIFYEPIPSAIRTVQRRGRTGRQDKGQVKVLVAKGTRDETYRWVAHHKEKRMHRAIKQFNAPEKEQQTTLEKPFKEEKLLIHVDDREKTSSVVKALMALGVDVQSKRLEVADYVLSEHTAIEFKTQRDFVNSLLDGRIFEQARNLKQYHKPLMIVEGDEDLYSQRNIHPNAIRGALTALALDFGIPLLQTKNSKETAAIMAVIAQREQKGSGKYTFHTAKPLTDDTLQEYLVSALPGVGPVLAPPLLDHFGSVRSVMSASLEELKKVKLIGEKKAERIDEILSKPRKKD